MLLCAAGLHFSINFSLMAKHLGAKSQFALVLSFQGYLFKQIALERWRQSLAYELIYFHSLRIKMEASPSQDNKDIKRLHLFPRNLCSHPCLISSCHSQGGIVGKFSRSLHIKPASSALFLFIMKFYCLCSQYTAWARLIPV